jgi:hypothetical protein
MTKTINQIRAETLERSRALAEVIALRDKLADARKRLAFVEADLAARPRQPTDNRDRVSDHIADLTKRLADAEAYCLQVNPDQLCEHDAKIAAAEEAAKAARMAEEAAHEIARREAAAKAEADGQARMAARKRRELEAIESE